MDHLYSKLTNLPKISGPEQPLRDHNLILTRIIAPIFLTPYNRIKSINQSLFLIFCLLFWRSAYTCSLSIYIFSSFLTHENKLKLIYLATRKSHYCEK